MGKGDGDRSFGIGRIDFAIRGLESIIFDYAQIESHNPLFWEDGKLLALLFVDTSNIQQNIALQFPQVYDIRKNITVEAALHTVVFLIECQKSHLHPAELN